MRFTLIDRITNIEPGSRLSAVKNLTMAEEYLQDHFPLFPVMPGVLMLEALYQSAAWLVRGSEDFAHSIVQLVEARNVKFSDFVQPGQSLVVEVKMQRQEGSSTWVQAEGSVDGGSAVKARLRLERFNLADRRLASPSIDDYMVRELRRDYQNLLGLVAPSNQAS